MPEYNSEIDRKIHKNIESKKPIKVELKTFFDKIIKSPETDISLVKDTLQKTFVTNQKKRELMEAIFQSNKIIDKNPPLAQQVHEMFTYLGFVESLASYYVNILVMLAVANGKDFRIKSMDDSPTINHAMCIEDLENSYTPLSIKLKFLKKMV